jgi:putative tryptophan/tyrosine transport system substrate-binding protein
VSRGGEPMRRRQFIARLGGLALAWPFAARAQQRPAQRLIGMVLNYERDNPEVQSWVAAFHENLKQLGWVDGQNIRIEYRWAGNDSARMAQAAKTLVAMQPELIVSPSSPTTAILLGETSTIPIIFVQIVDPVGQGFVKSLSRPGGNATGLVNLETSMTGKWLELLKQLAPNLTRVAIPFNPVSAPYADLYLNYFKSTAPSLGLEIVPVSVPDLGGFEDFAAAQERQPNSGCIPLPSGFSSSQVTEIAAILLRHRLPAIYVIRAFVEAGGLVSYGNDVIDNYRKAATFVDNILKGAKAADLPVQFPTNFDLAINLKTARTLGLTVPLVLRTAADEVIE